ncbi:glucosyltransferase [Clostridia bacterium]|nr:glucosyltransferase [Clostridia bacterium]
MPDTVTRIPIAMATDDKYILPMSVTIASLLANAAADTFCDIYIQTQDPPPPDKAERLLSFESLYPRCKIHLLNIDKAAFQHTVINVPHLGLGTFFRILLPETLAQHDRCIYLDTDTVVEKDLAELYSLDIGDNYIAAVREASFVETYTGAKNRAQKLGIPNLNQYINNGVMLMNLARMRKDGTQSKMLKLTSKGFASPCQDVMNAVCYGHIKILPFHYNVMVKFHPENVKTFFASRGCRLCYTNEERAQAVRSPTVIHYVNWTNKFATKPWNSSGMYLGERWWHYAKLSPFWPDIQRTYDHIKGSSV